MDIQKKRGERRIPTIETESEVRKTMRKLNEFLTNIVEKILKKIRWQNTKFNQQTISTIFGMGLWMQFDFNLQIYICLKNRSEYWLIRLKNYLLKKKHK